VKWAIQRTETNFCHGATLDVSVIGYPAESAPDKRPLKTGFLAVVPIRRVGQALWGEPGA